MDIEPRRQPGDGDDLERSSILGDCRQRRVLSLLLDRDGPTTVHELSVQLVARTDGVAPSAVTEADYRPVRMDLRHRCLPKLRAVGWIERRADGLVADESLTLGTEQLSPPDLRDPDHPFWEVVSVLLARPYRQDLASLVAERDRRVTVDELATELSARAPRVRLPDDRRLAVALYHLDLPKLASVGVVDFDPDERTAVRTDRLPQFADWANLERPR
jgi:hypothetical protein